MLLTRGHWPLEFKVVELLAFTKNVELHGFLRSPQARWASDLDGAIHQRSNHRRTFSETARLPPSSIRRRPCFCKSDKGWPVQVARELGLSRWPF